MLTAKDFEGKDIPIRGKCPICFDINRNYIKEYNNLRGHMVNKHGLPPLSNSERVASWVKRNREKYNAMQRTYQKKYRSNKYNAN